MAWRALIGTMLVGSLATACGEDGPGTAEAPSVVVAVSADAPLEGRMARVVARVTIDGGVPLVEKEASALPFEVVVPPLKKYTRVTATVEAFDDEGALLVRRIAATDVAGGRTLLLRTRLQDECVIAEAEHDVTCTGLTCHAGICEIPFIGAHRLEDYAPGWAEPRDGACGVVGGDEPVVAIGRAEPPFEPFADGETVVPQQGLQGASHFFLSVRMQGADPETARTITYGTILSTGRETNAVTIGDRYEDDCSLYLIPFVLPPEGVVDETMRLDVSVFDHTENTGHAHVDIHLAEPLPP